MIKLICLPQKDLAEALGVTYGTFRNWSSLRTDIPPQHRTALAAIMRTQAIALQVAAKELDREVARESGKTED